MKTRNGYPVYPLTVAQKFHTYYVEFSPKKEVLNIGTSLTIGAEIDFDELRKATGEKKFFAGLKKYYADCKFKRVKSEDLVGAFERIGVDVFGFFDGFLNGKDCGR